MPKFSQALPLYDMQDQQGGEPMKEGDMHTSL